MRIFVMTDMEGVAGVLDHDNWCQPPNGNYAGRYYDLGRELLTKEVNAAIDGFWRGGADDIVVVDGHGAGGIVPTLLDSRAKLLHGWSMHGPFGLDETFDGVAWVGQHAKAGTVRAHIAHTGWFDRLDYSINGTSIGEFGQTALAAGELGVPVIFGSGDEAFCREAVVLAPHITTVAVKQGLTPDDGADLDTRAYMRHNLAAIHLHPEVARRAIADRAQASMRPLHQNEKGWGLVVLPEPAPYERVILWRPDATGSPKLIDRAGPFHKITQAIDAPSNRQPLAE